MVRHAVILTLISLASGGLFGPAQSAVRDCADLVENSGGGKTEKEAKTNALDGWMTKVETLGMEQVRWQMAADRSLQCQATGGSYYCSARARPCLIKQVAPEAWRPQYPRDRRP
jgi:hypothetical protein